MTQDVTLSVLQFVNHQNVTHHVKNLKTLFVMSNVKDQIVKLCAQIRLVKWKIAQNVLPFVNLLIVLLIVKYLNQNVKPFVKNQDVIGNATNQNAQNQNVNLFVKIQLVDHNSNAVNVMLMDFL